MTLQEYNEMIRLDKEAAVEEAKATASAEATQKTREEDAARMLEEGIAIETASRVTGLTPEQIACLPKRS